MATIAPEIPVLARDEAFEKLYRRYVKDVYHYALALLRNPADAEDVTQTTFLNAYRAFQRGEEIRKPQNWLIKIAHNVARSRYARTSRRVKEVPLDDHVDQLAVPEEERPDVEGVLRALGRLPFNQRAALVMRELEGRSYAEIADTLGVSVAAVETLIFRARRSLRIRAAALRSLLAVPLPSSLSQFFDGGGSAAGGIGAGLLLKTAVALVVGSLATGAGVERVTQAAASSDHTAAAPAAAAPSIVRRTVLRTAESARVQAPVRAARAVAPRGRSVGTGFTRRASFRRSRSSRPIAAASGSGSASSPAPAPSAPAPPAETVAKTVQPVQGAADQVVAAVSTAAPASVVQVPALPVQPPALPKLP
jgi:RNA polymerase sigma factor (sigma-70 family)